MLLVFRGVCTEPRHEQCQVDLCYLDAIQNYGAASANVSKLMGFDLRTCARLQRAAELHRASAGGGENRSGEPIRGGDGWP